MANESLPPIPTPLNQWWREFRIQVVPVIFFVIIVLSVAFLWKDYVQPTSVVGEVESIQSTVSSLQDGIINGLTVERFDTVTEGQVLGEIAMADPELIQASLRAIEADLKVLQARLAMDEERRKFDYQQLRVDMMQERVDLATAQANLLSATNNYRRVKFQFDEGVSSEAELDLAQATMESLQAEVKERAQLIGNLEETLQSMETVVDPEGPDPIDEAIQAKEEELRLTLEPTPLIAPRAGVVGMLFKRAGEKVLRGEPILTINSTEGERIIAYLRQPVTKVPAINDTVEIHTRSRHRVHGTGQVLMVGAQMEPINPVLLSTDSNRIELGLPVLISLPAGLNVRPGEPVDLHINFSTE